MIRYFIYKNGEKWADYGSITDALECFTDCCRSYPNHTWTFDRVEYKYVSQTTMLNSREDDFNV